MASHGRNGLAGVLGHAFMPRQLAAGVLQRVDRPLLPIRSRGIESNEREGSMIAFGPVPSRRLGRSLGINNIPPKVCTYSCAYCQLGRTIKMQVDRRAFYQPEEILKDVEEKVKRAREVGESIDYLTFVPDGEPTLDINLGHEIELLKPLGIKIAVITNASLIGREDVRDDLMKADWVSLKVDSIREDVWRRINRPHRTLQLASILDGMLEFAKAYGGKPRCGELATETMLVEGVNDSDSHLEEVADFLAQLRPARAYLSIPTRPPAEKWVQPPSEEVINQAYQFLGKRQPKASPFMFPVKTAIHLAKFRHSHSQLFLTHADACIGYSENKCISAIKRGG